LFLCLSKETNLFKNEILKNLKEKYEMKSLLVLYSYHHHNTEKVAKVFARVFDAEIKWPQELNPEEIKEYDLVGFGSGIYGGKNHESLLELVDKLPQSTGKNAFIFSTCGAPIALGGQKTLDDYALKCHSLLREKLKAKSYVIIDEFICAGFNTNSFLKLFGGINKGRPNVEDLRRAEEFALNLKEVKLE
jgi:flavodoxin